LKLVSGTVRILTFAEGLFSRLAHDLELGVDLSDAAITDAEATLRVPLADIVVRGVRKDGRVDPSVLSASDQRDILAKMKKDVFHVADGVIEVVATRTTVTVKPPRGPAVSRPLRLDFDGEGAKGSFDLSLAALGSDPVKGPMNAFRVKDRVAVELEVSLSGTP
jgi:hypothetical protein